MSTANFSLFPDAAAGEMDSWNAPTGEIALTWQPIEGIRVYGKYTRGFKAGQFNADLGSERTLMGTFESIASLTAVDPEEVDAFEVGVKGIFFDERLEIALSDLHLDPYSLERLDERVLDDAPGALLAEAEIDLELGLGRHSDRLIDANLGEEIDTLLTRVFAVQQDSELS